MIMNKDALASAVTGLVADGKICRLYSNSEAAKRDMRILQRKFPDTRYELSFMFVWAEQIENVLEIAGEEHV